MPEIPMRKVLLPFIILVACAEAPDGLLATPAGDGPVVHFDWDAKPLPEIPFPNDLATRPDETSPTGLRLNISLEAPTRFEKHSREAINEMTGFGIYAPIAVAFEDRLDLDNVIARHRDDPRPWPEQRDDDAFFVIDVTPTSPTYLEPVQLDVGHGRFPMDSARSDRYFTNDTRAQEPSVVFDTVDEDLNGNGILDWGEDTDNDGVLDVPNVYPPDGDPRADLLDWYELQTDTLLMRPVVPLREETRYAVVLTQRLTGDNGSPVQSPWEWVHHTRQTQALAPLEDALPALGLCMEDVAFAWTFTTGRVTGDLVDIRRGLYGEGPFFGLETQFPAGVTEASTLHELEGLNPYELATSTIMEVLLDFDVIEGDGGQVIVDIYDEFSSHVVGGVFMTPNFLTDHDDDSIDDGDNWADERFHVDVATGEWTAEEERVPFTCMLPKENDLHEAPYPVAIFGHGYQSSRFESFTFMWGLARQGMAACTIDYPGHGPRIDPELMGVVEVYLAAQGLAAFGDHLLDSRQRDLNNDGVPDSGGDQWSADAPHTRDMVRQAAVDMIQLVRSLRSCGEDTMLLADGSEAMSCDWNQDGSIDLGGPDVDYYMAGGSLGGINTGVAAGVMPEVKAFVPIVSGAGLVDVGLRTEISGAVEAMSGRLMSPLIVGTPDGKGGLQVAQVVNSVTDMVTVPIATLGTIPSGGRIVVENLDLDETREGWVPEDGTFRVGIPADAMDPAEKAIATQMPADGPVDGATYGVVDNEGLGDRLRITLYDAEGEIVSVIESFESEVQHEGVTMEAGSPLIAASYGTGRIRSTPDLRRIAAVFGAMLEPGDPIAYAPLYFQRPPESLGGQSTNVLLMPTIGDSLVPFSGGLAHARAAGIIPQDQIDDRYGMTVDAWLDARSVIQGLEEHGPYTCGDSKTPCLFDPDDLDEGLDGTGASSDEPLRLSVGTDSGVSGLRIPYVSTQGSHGWGLPDPGADFDIHTFSLMQISAYFHSGGKEIMDDHCLEDMSCEFIPIAEEDDEPDDDEPGGDGTGGDDTGSADTGSTDTGWDTGASDTGAGR
jgi:hypothetical protein